MLEQLMALGPVRAKAMFGGYGLYYDDVIFGMLIHNELYFKAGKDNLADFQQFECEPFVYTNHRGRPVVMSYYRVPSRVLSNSMLLKEWMLKAYDVSRTAKKKTKRPYKNLQYPRRSR